MAGGNASWSWKFCTAVTLGYTVLDPGSFPSRGDVVLVVLGVRCQGIRLSGPKVCSEMGYVFRLASIALVEHLMGVGFSAD